MRQRILSILTGRRFSIKQEWVQRLRREPVRSALAEPSVLVYRMDETLDRLGELLTRRQSPGRAMHEDDFERRCECRLNPLIAYFFTGEAALLAVLSADGEIDEPSRAFVALYWRLLAQSEIDVLCGLCIRTCQHPFPTASGLLTSPGVGADGRDKQ